MSRQGEKRERTFQNIRQFWEAEASDWGETCQATIRDHSFRIHELQTLLSLIPRSNQLLDIGCGAGFGTFVLSQRAIRTVGIDYSPAMIRWAQQLQDDPSYRQQIRSRLSPFWSLDPLPGTDLFFHTGDVLDLKLDYPPFDAVTAQRLLINLPQHGDQMKALENLRRCAHDSATLFLVESTRQGHERTDAYRARFDLSPLEKYWHNCYVDESRYVEWEKYGWRVMQTLGFDAYMLLSKVVYPAAYGESRCVFLSGANTAAMETANLFRTQSAAEEIGVPALLRFYVERVRLYNLDEANAIEAWIEKRGGELVDWSGLGHQQIIIAQAE
ncbi:MAG: class I SAM-dependent methyltransferase [Candidatus Omnitrophota bacterium]